MPGFTAINGPPTQRQPAKQAVTTSITELKRAARSKRSKPDAASAAANGRTTVKASGKGKKRASQTADEPKPKRRKMSDLARTLSIRKTGTASTGDAGHGKQGEDIPTDAFEPDAEDVDCLLNALSMIAPMTSMDKASFSLRDIASGTKHH